MSGMSKKATCGGSRAGSAARRRRSCFARLRLRAAERGRNRPRRRSRQQARTSDPPPAIISSLRLPSRFLTETFLRFRAIAIQRTSGVAASSVVVAASSPSSFAMGAAIPSASEPGEIRAVVVKEWFEIARFGRNAPGNFCRAPRARHRETPAKSRGFRFWHSACACLGRTGPEGSRTAMDNTLLVSLSHQLASYRSMDVIANNLANLSTPAFKREEAQFAEYVETVPPSEGRDRSANALPSCRTRACVRDYVRRQAGAHRRAVRFRGERSGLFRRADRRMASATPATDISRSMRKARSSPRTAIRFRAMAAPSRSRPTMATSMSPRTER